MVPSTFPVSMRRHDTAFEESLMSLHDGLALVFLLGIPVFLMWRSAHNAADLRAAPVRIKQQRR
jgi:hypothetical protein